MSRLKLEYPAHFVRVTMVLSNCRCTDASLGFAAAQRQPTIGKRIELQSKPSQELVHDVASMMNNIE